MLGVILGLTVILGVGEGETPPGIPLIIKVSPFGHTEPSVGVIVTVVESSLTSASKPFSS
jgi:hypothetical protein